MTFSFHNYFEQAARQPEILNCFSRTGSFAFASALHQQFIDMGLNPSALVDLDCDEIGSHAGILFDEVVYTASGTHNLSELGEKYKVIEAQNLANAATWKGVSKQEFKKHSQFAQDIIRDAVILSVNALPAKEIKSDCFEAKMKRAKAQGFDIAHVHYHETESENAQSILEKGFDLKKVGARGSDKHMPDGVFVKPTTESIELAHSPVQLPMLVRSSSTAKFKDRDDLVSYLMQDKLYAELLEKHELVADHYDPIYMGLAEDWQKASWRNEACPIKQEELKAKQEEISNKMNSTMDEWKKATVSSATAARERGTEFLKSKGYEAISINKDLGSFGREIETLIVLDPQNIRCLSHPFEPEPKKVMEQELSF